VIAELLGKPADTISTGQMSNDLCRLRHHGLIERQPGTHRYQITEVGLTDALFLTRAHDLLRAPGLPNP
jgi:DNA-binding HxlR family transcriptional regulator